MTFIMKIYTLTIITLILLLHNTQQSDILDFQYTQYIQTLSQNHQHNTDLDFTPTQIPTEKLTFPQACNALNMLSENLVQQKTPGPQENSDGYLNYIKTKFLKLLTLTQKLDNSEEKILHFQTLINQTNPVPPKQSQIIELEKYEANLKNLTDRITSLDQQLKSAIDEIDAQNSNNNLNEAKKIELDYKIDWLGQKIDYLRKFQSKARLAKDRSGSEIDYIQYFKEMDDLFKKEDGLISQIDLIIRKKDKMNELRKQRSNLNASVAALELYIADIKECNTEKEKIRNEFKNHEKINQLIHQLKVLKKNEEPNIYCQGVVKKLTEKIRTMVRYYAIVASCASDLEPKLQDLAKEMQKLMEVEEHIANFEGVDNLEDFEKDYKDQKQEVKKMYSKVKEWKMKQFIHDPEKIAEILLRAQGQLALAKKQKQAIIETGQPAQSRKAISHSIVELIKQNRELKHKYCITYHKYDSLSNSVWSQTYRYESEMNLKNSLWKVYNQERENYNAIYKEFITERDEIHNKLQ